MHGVFSFIFRRFDRLRSGGDDGIRTHDPLLAGQALSQLSYTPISRWVRLSGSLFKDL